MNLTSKQKKILKGLAHHLKPVVSIGNAGVTEAVISELDAALEHHELLKLKLPSVEREQRLLLANDVCEKSSAQNVQMIGRCVLLYRVAAKPKINLK